MLNVHSQQQFARRCAPFSPAIVDNPPRRWRCSARGVVRSHVGRVGSPQQWLTHELSER